jgi:DNA invertase Pin-like site-specific DNA recombinase
MQVIPQSNIKRRTALYARVSTADQKTGLEAQVRALRIFCEQNKISDYELFADENISGTKASRPGLDRMMRAVEAGEVDSVVVFAFSRFARSVSHMLKGLETMKKHSTNFVSLTEKIDLNTSLGHVVFVLVSAIAQLERDLISERVRNGLANARAKGKLIGRVRKRNSVLIESLLDAGLSFREISRICRCSHGSVGAQKREYFLRLEKEGRFEELTRLKGLRGRKTRSARNSAGKEASSASLDQRLRSVEKIS